MGYTDTHKVKGYYPNPNKVENSEYEVQIHCNFR